ncbi:MAG: hypothetical protein M1816_002119 [Peltula sp. TS41687]|nr:MAG: hypothetical protein M1816_002119 [Peltula sp. TS41687]
MDKQGPKRKRPAEDAGDDAFKITSLPNSLQTGSRDPLSPPPPKRSRREPSVPMHMSTRRSARGTTSSSSSALGARSRRTSPKPIERQSPAIGVVASVESLQAQAPEPPGVVVSPEGQQPPEQGVVNGEEGSQPQESRPATASTTATPVEKAPARPIGRPPGRRPSGKGAAKGQPKGQSKVEKRQRGKRRTKNLLGGQELRYWGRQEELKRKYNALAAALRPCLDELAERNFASLQQNPTAHQQSPFSAVVGQQLAARTQGAVKLIELQKELVAGNLATKLESEEGGVRNDCSWQLERLGNELRREMAEARRARTEEDRDDVPRQSPESEPDGDSASGDEEAEFALGLLTSASKAMGYAEGERWQAQAEKITTLQRDWGRTGAHASQMREMISDSQIPERAEFERLQNEKEEAKAEVARLMNKLKLTEEEFEWFY